jgi:hypothetical protein
MKYAICHPLKKHYARGLCKPCYVRHLGQNNKKRAICHPLKKHHAKGLCTTCHAKQWRQNNKKHAICHPLKKHYARGLCAACYAKQWRQNNKKRHNFLRKLWSDNKYRSDVNYRLLGSLRSRVHSAFRANKCKKGSKTLDLIGCSIQQLKQHLELQFKKGMTWDNYGRGWNNQKEWHIDHIRPCASFNLTKLEEQQKCFHYSNLQPLWAKDNYIKGNKI